MVRRLALTVIVSLLTISASGLSALAVLEPCSGLEQTAEDEGTCPPTCVTCGCCAQAVEPVALLVTSASNTSLAGPGNARSRLTNPQPRDILHVPRLRLA